MHTVSINSVAPTTLPIVAVIFYWVLLFLCVKMPDPAKSAPAPKKGSKKAVTKVQKKDGKKRRKKGNGVNTGNILVTLRFFLKA